MRKAFLFLAGTLFLAGILSSQEYKGNGRIIGFVFDQEGKPLEGVKIKLVYVKSNEGYDVVTDKDGKWVGAWMRGGAWNVDFEKIGYATRKLSFQISELQKNPDMKVTMQKVEGLILTEELKQGLIKGNELFDQKDYQTALDIYNGLVEKYPEAYILWKNVGNCYFAQEKYDEAEAAYRKILERDPQNRDALVLVGNCYANRNQPDQALEWYDKVQFEKIEDPVVLYNIGTSYFNLSKFEEALKYFQRSIEVQKDFEDGFYQLGVTYASLQKNAEAIATFEKFLKLFPDSSRAPQVHGFLEYLKKK
jgi:tetratricopeptide (TPR) repeat protein